MVDREMSIEDLVLRTTSSDFVYCIGIKLVCCLKGTSTNLSLSSQVSKGESAMEQSIYFEARRVSELLTRRTFY